MILVENKTFPFKWIDPRISKYFYLCCISIFLYPSEVLPSSEQYSKWPLGTGDILSVSLDLWPEYSVVSDMCSAIPSKPKLTTNVRNHTFFFLLSVMF